VEENIAGGQQANEPRHKAARVSIEQPGAQSSNRSSVLQQVQVESHSWSTAVN